MYDHTQLSRLLVQYRALKDVQEECPHITIAEAIAYLQREVAKAAQFAPRNFQIPVDRGLIAFSEPKFSFGQRVLAEGRAGIVTGLVFGQSANWDYFISFSDEESEDDSPDYIFGEESLVLCHEPVSSKPLPRQYQVAVESLLTRFETNRHLEPHTACFQGIEEPFDFPSGKAS